MGIVVSLAEIRNGRMKDALLVYALEGEPAIVETRTCLIAAEKILCRDRLVEMFNAAGDYFAVSYSDIVGISAGAAKQQTSVVSAAGDWTQISERKSRRRKGKLLPFVGERRR